MCLFGDYATQWDHLNAIVRDKEPTGYITEISNLVPCCSICNSSKGNTKWSLWIKSERGKTPTARKKKILEERIKRLEEYEIKFRPLQLDNKQIIDKEEYGKFFALRDSLLREMSRCDEEARKIHDRLIQYVKKD